MYKVQKPACAGLGFSEMRRPLLRVHLHLVWATWDRRPALSPSVRLHVHAAIAEKARALNSDRVSVGGVADHVHVLLDMPSTVSIADLVRHLKGNSSHLVNALDPRDEPFRWQGSYGAFSVDDASVETVRRYVLDQERHHAQGDTFADLEQTCEQTASPKPREGEAL